MYMCVYVYNISPHYTNTLKDMQNKGHLGRIDARKEGILSTTPTTTFRTDTK